MEKKKLSQIRSLSLLVLAALLTVVVLFTPVAKFNTFDNNCFDKDGRYTKNAITVAEVDIGFGTAIEIAKNFSDISSIVSIQMLDVIIESTDDNRRDATDKDSIQRYEEKLAKYTEKRDKKIEKITADDEKRIKEKLQDEDFVSALTVIYAITNGEIMNSMGTNYEPSDVEMIRIVFGTLAYAFLIIFTLAYSVIIIVKFIAILIKYLSGLKKDDVYEKTEKKLEKFPFVKYVMVLLLSLFMAIFINSMGLEVASGFVLACVIWILANTVFAIGTIFENKDNMVKIIVKKGLTILGAVAALIVLVNFRTIDLFRDYESVYPALSAVNKADSDLFLKVMPWILLGICSSILFGMTFIRFVERFGDRTYKTKSKKIRPYGQMIAWTVVVFVIALIPTLINTSSSEAKNEAISKGNYKLCLTEHKEAGTSYNTKYELLKYDYEQVNSSLENADETLAGLDEKDAELIISNYEVEKSVIQRKIDRIEGRASSAVMCIVAAIILLLLEIAYTVVNKKMPDKTAPMLAEGVSEAEVVEAAEETAEPETETDTVSE